MLKEKIKSNNGATLLLALLFFLLCSVVGSVILAAGSASAGRISGLANQEQAYYTVSSAAQLFRDEIDAQKYIKIVTTKEDSSTTETFDPDGSLGSLLSAAATDVYLNKNTMNYAGYSKSLNLSGITGMNNVKAKFVMEPDYSVKVNFSLDGDDNEALYQLTLTIEAVVGEVSDIFTYEVTTGSGAEEVVETRNGTIETTTVTWGNGCIVKD